MGAVVGSMYAIGHDADQVNSIAHNIDWQTIFNDRLERNQLSFRRKQEDRRILLPYRLGFENGKPVLPKGVMGGQQLYATIQSLTADWLATENFDKLPIPFRAVATNIVTGDPVALGNGSLSTAVFASMSIPAAFPPVSRDGLLLVDGGISDNLPVDVARAMGVDIVIVVDVGDPPMQKDQITSAFSVFGQMQLLLGYAAVRDQRASLGGRDVLILPDITNISALSFDKLDYGIELGVAAAKAQADKLAGLSVDDATWAQYLAERKARTDPTPIVIDKIEIANDSKVPDKQIMAKVTVQPGEVLNGQQMKTDVQNIFAMDEFDRVYYDVLTNDGADILQVNTRTNPAANKYFQFGLLVASDIGTQSQFDIAIAYTDRNFLGTGGEWRGFARFGSNILLDVALYKQWGGFFIEPAAYYQRDSSFIIRAGSVDGNETLQLSRAGAAVRFRLGVRQLGRAATGRQPRRAQPGRNERNLAAAAGLEHRHHHRGRLYLRHARFGRVPAARHARPGAICRPCRCAGQRVHPQHHQRRVHPAVHLRVPRRSCSARAAGPPLTCRRGLPIPTSATSAWAVSSTCRARRSIR